MWLGEAGVEGVEARPAILGGAGILMAADDLATTDASPPPLAAALAAVTGFAGSELVDQPMRERKLRSDPPCRTMLLGAMRRLRLAAYAFARVGWELVTSV